MLALAVLLAIATLSVSWLSWAKIPVSLFVFAALVWFMQRYIRWVSTHFVLTSDRVIFRTGIIAKHGIEIPLERINTIFFHQRIFERMLGLGDLDIESASKDGAQRFNDIRNPSGVQNEIYQQMEANLPIGSLVVSIAHRAMAMPTQFLIKLRSSVHCVTKAC